MRLIARSSGEECFDLLWGGVVQLTPASTGALDLYALCFELFQLAPERVRAHAQAQANRVNVEIPLADAMLSGDADGLVSAAAQVE